jgi:hypothetical protein
MLYSWPALSAVWVVLFGVFAVLASGTVAGRAQWLVALAGLAAPAIILAIDERFRKTPAPVPMRYPWPNSGFRNIGRGTKGG